MININSYIIEKLHLNKDIKVNNNIYVMFTLVSRYREEKYIVPDIVEITKLDEDKNLLIYKCLTNFHNQKNNEEAITFKTIDNSGDIEYFSNFIISRNMVFIKLQRAKKILNESEKINNYTLCWKQLLDKDYKITGRNVFYDVYLYNEKIGNKLRKNSYAKPKQMEKLDEDNIKLLIYAIKEYE